MIFGQGTLYIGRQVRFPRSKRKRIREKWQKRRENWSHFIAPQRVTNVKIGQVRHDRDTQSYEPRARIIVNTIDGIPYRLIVDYLLATDQVRWPEPCFPMDVAGLEYLAGRYAERVEWLCPVRVCLSEPDLVDDETLREKLWSRIVPGSAPLAMVEMEAGVDGDVYGRPTVHILHPRFLTVGVLLHELAHLWRPTVGTNLDHGDGFLQAYRDLVAIWHDDFSKQFV